MNEIQKIEQYVQGTMSEAEAVLFEERFRRDVILRTNVVLHRQVMAIVKMYHRKRLKMQLEEVHARLFRDPLKANWRQRVLGLFHNS